MVLISQRGGNEPGLTGSRLEGGACVPTFLTSFMGTTFKNMYLLRTWFTDLYHPPPTQPLPSGSVPFPPTHPAFTTTTRRRYTNSRVGSVATGTDRGQQTKSDQVEGEHHHPARRQGSCWLVALQGENAQLSCEVCVADKSETLLASSSSSPVDCASSPAGDAPHHAQGQGHLREARPEVDG